MSDENEPLGSILGGASAFHAEVKAQPVVAEPAKPEPVAAESAAPGRDEQGRFAKAEEPKPEVQPEQKAVVEPEKPAKTPESALAEMSRRLRIAEARARELEGQQQAKPMPSILDDEDAAINARIDARLNGYRAGFLDQSIELAKLRHADSWADAEAGFIEAAESNPDLINQFRQAQNPGEFAYNHGVFYREMAKYGGNVIAMRDGIRSESAKQLGEANARIKALEEQVKSLQATKQEVESLSKSLNNRASAVVTAETIGDPDRLEDIVRFGTQRG